MDEEIRSLYQSFLATGRLTSRLSLHAQLYGERYRHGHNTSGPQPVPTLTREETEKVCLVSDKVYAAAKVFEGARWYWGGLQTLVNAADSRFLQGRGSGSGGGWTVLLGCLAGRCLITLRDDATGESVTLITADDEAPFQRLAWGSTGMGPMGVQGIEATEEVALRLIQTATLHWPELKPAPQATFG